MNDDNFNRNFMNGGSNNFQNLLEINQHFLIKAFETQNKQNYEESVKCLEKIYKNFHLLGMMADQIPYTPTVIRENREILSQAHLENIQERLPFKMNSSFELDKNISKANGKKKQNKTKWSTEEQELFLEGLELFGLKNVKKISEHVKTRSINQVRSHLQKHQLKEKKINDKIKFRELNEINTIISNENNIESVNSNNS